MSISIVLETDRLVLREAVLEDNEFFLSLLSDPLWHRYIGMHSVNSLTAASDYIKDRLISSYGGGYGLWVVALKNSGVPVGICGLLRREYLEDVDLGYAFLEPYRGLGYAFESSNAVLTYLAPKICTSKVLAMTHPDNSSSIYLLNKLGFKFVRVYQKTDSEDVTHIHEILC